MSVEKGAHDKIIFICNSCQEEIITPEKKFFDAWRYAKSEGWTQAEEKHKCGKCNRKDQAPANGSNPGPNHSGS